MVQKRKPARNILAGPELEVLRVARERKKPDRHRTVRIPVGMVQAIEEFLKTLEANRLGYDSRADVVTAAIREFLKEMEKKKS